MDSEKRAKLMIAITTRLVAAQLSQIKIWEGDGHPASFDLTKVVDFCEEAAEEIFDRFFVEKNHE